MARTNFLTASKLLVVIFSLTALADKAAASDNKPESLTTEFVSAGAAVQPEPPKKVSVYSVPYLDALNFEYPPEPQPKISESPAPVPIEVYAFPITITAGNPTPPRGPQGISSIPMTPRQKFKLFATKSFNPPWPYVTSAFVGAFEELIDNNEGKDQDTGDFMADWGSRASRNFTARITANFFEKFAYAVAFKQDPRYHRSDKIKVGGKIGYALSRLFLTRGDNGNTQFNASYLLGAVTAAALSNVWETERNRGPIRSVKRLAIHFGFTAISNIVHEFRGGF